MVSFLILRAYERRPTATSRRLTTTGLQVEDCSERAWPRAARRAGIEESLDQPVKFYANLEGEDHSLAPVDPEINTLHADLIRPEAVSGLVRLAL
jgi:hypothetical protein